MKLSITRLSALLGLVSACQLHFGVALAATNTCYWGPAGEGGMTFFPNMGTVFVPSDAPIGSVIGTARQYKYTSNNEGRSIACSNDGNARLLFNAQTSVPPIQNIPPRTGAYRGVHALLPTNIPGIGATFELGFPFDGSADNAFVPDTGDATVPFSAHQTLLTSTVMDMANLESYVTLVKTGPIAPGPQSFNGQELFSGELTGILGKAFRVGLAGTVIQAHCGSNRVSADPVQLGDWDLADFTSPGYTTTAVPFTITLSSCVADPTDTNIATANIRFDGSGGSAPVAPPIPGVFSLIPSSSARGIGIQILKGDRSTPVELSTEVPIQQITTGDTVLDFAARFYQVDATSNLAPGDAKGALHFTLTYK